jgi:hypothetical protein
MLFPVSERNRSKEACHRDGHLQILSSQHNDVRHFRTGTSQFAPNSSNIRYAPKAEVNSGH